MGGAEPLRRTCGETSIGEIHTCMTEVMYMFECVGGMSLCWYSCFVVLEFVCLMG